MSTEQAAVIEAEKQLTAQVGDITLMRPDPVIEVGPVDEYDEEVGLALRDDKYLEALASVGLHGDVGRMAVSLSDWQRRWYANNLMAVGGGVTRSAMKILNAIDELNDDIAGEKDVEREKVLREDRRGLLQTLVSMYDRCSQAALTQATVAKMKNEGRGRQSRKATLEINADSGAQVNVAVAEQ